MVFLRCRPVQSADLVECLLKMRDFYCHTEETRGQLQEMWEELLQDGISNFSLIEDTEAPQGQQILWFSFKVFVSEDFVTSLGQMTRPLSRSLLARWQQDRRVILNLAEYHRAAQRGGVPCVVLNYGTPRDAWSGPKQIWVASKSIEWSWYSTCGYPLQSLHLETYGPFEWAWAKGFGLCPRNEYAEFSAVAGRDIPPDNSPRLFGAEAQDLAAYAGTPLSIIFRRQEPLFYFSEPEQKLLLWAFSGDTDAEVSAALHAAPVTIKKRWQSIYERVEAISPEMLGGAENKKGKRGLEKKRRLLNYLRHHMEELRPLLPQKK